MSLLLISAIVLVVIFALSNGMKDGLNVAATTIASKSLPTSTALVLVICAELFGPYFFGTQVARTVAKNIVNVPLLQQNPDAILMVTGGLIGAILWNFLAWWMKLPTSSSFTLVGGLIGPVFYTFGWAGVPWAIFLVKVVAAMFLSPLLGIGLGYLVFQLAKWVFADASLQANNVIRKIQYFTLVFLGVNHGANDSQKAMGIIALLLFLAGHSAAIVVPFWVQTLSILAITTGVAVGGTRIIRTVGYGIFKLRPHHSFEAQLTSASILLSCNLIGAPVSTTQIITSSVIGVGSGFRKKSVRWLIITDIVWSWILTIPLTALFSAGIYWIMKILLRGE